MTTKYQCAGCNAVFNGIDPFRWPNSPTEAEAMYPLCPIGEDEKSALDSGQHGLETLADLYDAIDMKHVVRLGIVDKPPISTIDPVATPIKPVAPVTSLPKAPTWGNKAFVFQVPQGEEAKRLEADAKERAFQAALQKKRDELAADARRLVNRIELAMQSMGSYATGHPDDEQYGVKDSGSLDREPKEVIAAAAQVWLAMGGGRTFRAPAFKPNWQVHMANSEKPRAAGGKKNYHVTVK